VSELSLAPKAGLPALWVALMKLFSSSWLLSLSETTMETVAEDDRLPLAVRPWASKAWVAVPVQSLDTAAAAGWTVRAQATAASGMAARAKVEQAAAKSVFLGEVTRFAPD